MTKNFKNLTAEQNFDIFFIAIYLSFSPHKGRTSYRRSRQPSKENIQYFKTWNFSTFFYFCGSQTLRKTPNYWQGTSTAKQIFIYLWSIFCKVPSRLTLLPPRVEAGWETYARRTLLHQRPEQAHFHPARPPFRPTVPGNTARSFDVRQRLSISKIYGPWSGGKSWNLPGFSYRPARLYRLAGRYSKLTNLCLSCSCLKLASESIRNINNIFEDKCWNKYWRQKRSHISLTQNIEHRRKLCADNALTL